MKKAILLLLTLCMLIPLAACGETTDDGYRIYDGYQLLPTTLPDYYIQIPSGWRIDSTSAMPRAVCSTVDATNISVIAQSLADPSFGGKETAIERLDAYWETYGKVDAAILGNYTNPYVNEDIKDIKDWPANGKELMLSAKAGKKVDAKRYLYSILRGKETYVVDQTICIYGENVYLITLVAPEANYDALHINEMKDILSFFQFRR